MTRFPVADPGEGQAKPWHYFRHLYLSLGEDHNNLYYIIVKFRIFRHLQYPN